MFPFHGNRGVLGLNARNLLYIRPFNPRKAVQFADDKLKTKAFLSARGIPVAKLYARIETLRQLREFDFSTLPDECVLKPNYGFGGEGILVLRGRDASGNFLIQGKRPVTREQLTEHIEDILDGKFSVNGLPDTAFFEKILEADESLAPFRPAGLPDFRIIVFNLVPVMAMLRVPTAQSGGKANVHLGGIGIGIDIANGVTTYATQFNRIITELPHGAPPGGHAIPRWEEMLLIASRIQYITNIGYVAVDLTLDAEQGPVLLEVNARAGLMVQVANMAPLRSRLERVQGLKVSTPERGVRIAQDLFGRKRVEAHEQEEKTILGTSETIRLSSGDTTADVPALLDPKEERSQFQSGLLRELMAEGLAEPVDETEGMFRVKFVLGGRKITTVVRASSDIPSQYRAIVGKRDLQGFLIDPLRSAPIQTVAASASVRDNMRSIDHTLAQIDESLMLHKLLKPTNLAEERSRAEVDRRYDPILQYAPIDVDLDAVEEKLQSLSPDDSPIGILLGRKRTELLQRVSLLRARGKSRAFTDASRALFGDPTSNLLTAATSFLHQQEAISRDSDDEEKRKTDAVAQQFISVLEKYGLHEWRVEVSDRLVADCTVGGSKIYLRRGATFTQTHIESLIAHEIETHVLTAENGSQQPYELFRRGTANYLDTQEGMAIVNQNRVLPPGHPKRLGAARNLLGIAFAMEHSFAETLAYLEGLGYPPEKAMNKAFDCKRGLSHTAEPGAFTKSIVYFRGQRTVEQFLAAGGDMRSLYIGKIALEDLPLIEAMDDIKEPLILPLFLRETQPPTKKRRTKKKTS